MSKKQNKKTFAQRAKEIQNKYAKLKDTISQESMERELQSLMQEQEATREQMGLNNQEQPTQEFSKGGRMQYDGLGNTQFFPKETSILPSDFELNSNLLINKKFNTIPSEFAVRSAVQMAPYYRQRPENRLMPLQDLSGISPGVTDVDVVGQQQSDIYKQSYPTPNLYNQPNDSTLAPINIPPLTPDQLGIMSNTGYEPKPNRVPYSYDVNKVVPNYRSYKNTPLNPSKSSTTQHPVIKTNQSVNTNTNTTTPKNTQSKKTKTPSYDPNSRLVTNTARLKSINTPKLNNLDSSKLDSMNVLSDSQIKYLQQQSKALEQDTFWNNNKQYLPSAVSGLSNITSNLLLAKASQNIPKNKATQTTAKRINVAPQAEQLRRDATASKNVALRNARNLGLNAGATMANVGATNAGIDRGLGSNLTNLYMGQEQFNVGAANQAALSNQAAMNRANMYNTQLQNQALQDKLEYYGAAASTIPGVMQDIRLQNRDNYQMDMWNRYMSQPRGHYIINPKTGKIEYYD